MLPELVLGRVALLVPLVLALTVHEWAHAWVARLLGDDTAERLGRVSLNPLAHLDPVGTVLLPLLGIPFGWAKPVPVEPSRFRPEISMGGGLLLTAAAGPAANLLLALGCAAALHLLAFPEGEPQAVQSLLLLSTRINVGLALFNLLPVPPLDGSRIVDAFVPFAWRRAWELVGRAGLVVLVALIALPQLFAVTGPAAWMEWLSQRLMHR